MIEVGALTVEIVKALGNGLVHVVHGQHADELAGLSDGFVVGLGGDGGHAGLHGSGGTCDLVHFDGLAGYCGND